MATSFVLSLMLAMSLHNAVLLVQGDNQDDSTAQRSVSTGQIAVDYIAKHGQVTVSVVDNLHKVDGIFVTMEMTLTNTGQLTIGTGDWRIYYYALYSTGSKGELLNCGLRVCPVDKFLFYFTPAGTSFRGIGPGDTLRCIFHNKKWSVARTDQMPNWYVTSGNAVPKTIESTVGEELSFVGEFTSPAQWKTSKEDKYNPNTPAERYAMYKMSTNASSPRKLVPTPFRSSGEDGTAVTCTAANQWVVVRSKHFQFESNFLADALQLPVVNSTPSDKYILFMKTNDSGSTDPESYGLDIVPRTNVITIRAEDARGVMHGVQTLVSLAESENGRIPKMSIYDKPRYQYRGLLLDTARNFKPKAWVLKLLDVMSMYKLNYLHLHLTDDEGWRIEIPQLPELTQIGSQRCHSEDGLCLVPTLGSGPNNTTVGSGFYSVSDYREILKYAANRHITIVPELDLPGHSTAAITSMSFHESRRHPDNKIDQENESFLLNDIKQNKTCGETYHKYNAVNPCLNSTYKFVEKVVDALIWLHHDVMPLKTLHVGGDEVAAGVWDRSPACQSLFRNTKLDTRRLQTMFFERVTEIVTSRGLNIGVWDDGVYMEGKPYDISHINASIQVYPWDNRWETNHAKRAYEFAEANYKVVLTFATHLYFSHTYEPDPEERGVTWATRFVDTRKVFGMMPDSVYSNADVTWTGDPVDLAKMCQNNQCPRTTKPENIIGMQACLWSETTRTEDQLHYMLFPKLLALAERAWHKAPWEDDDDVTSRDKVRRADWESFVSTLGNNELPRLERRGIKYRVPPPGAVVEGAMLKVNTQYPNHVTEMSTDEGATWSTVVEARQLPAGHNIIKLRTRSPVLRRKSRVTELKVPSLSSAGTSQPRYLVITAFILVCKMIH